MPNSGQSRVGIQTLINCLLALLVGFGFLSLAQAADKGNQSLSRFQQVFSSQEAAAQYFQKFQVRTGTSSAWSGPSYSSKIDDEFSDLLRWFANQQLESTKLSAVEKLQAIRAGLPVQLRWLLAAFEIQTQKVTAVTLKDTLSALHNLELVESFSLDLGVFFTRGSKALIYRDFGGGKIRMFSGNELLFVESAWQQLPMLSEALGHTYATDSILDASRANWLRVLAKLELEVEITNIRKAVQAIDHPLSLKFVNSNEKENFLEASLGLLFNLYAQYRRSAEVSNGRLVTTQPGVDQFKILSEVIKRWVLSDLDFVIKNYDRLNRRGLIEANEVVLRNLSPAERLMVQEYLERKRKLPIDSYLISAMLWSHSAGEASESQLNQLASKAIVNLLFEVTKAEYGIKIGQFGYESQLLSQVEYKKLLALFVNLFGERLHLAQDQARRLFELRTPRPSAFTEKEWYEFEWKRLMVVQNSLPKDEFKSLLVQKLLASGSLSERLLVARFLRIQLKVSDLDKISTQLKIKTQSIAEKKFKATQYQDWIKNDGELIALLNALNPQDAELRKFLTEVYAERSVSGPVAGQSALMLLAEAGIASEEVRDEILRRLQFVSAGDSAGTFKAFIKLFPEDAVNIVAIIHRHRVVPQKLSMMLVHLVNQAEENPQLLQSVKQGLGRQADRSAATALYQGLVLDKWLEQKLKQKSEAANPVIIDCREIFGE